MSGDAIRRHRRAARVLELARAALTCNATTPELLAKLIARGGFPASADEYRDAIRVYEIAAGLEPQP